MSLPAGACSACLCGVGGEWEIGLYACLGYAINSALTFGYVTCLFRNQSAHLNQLACCAVGHEEVQTQRVQQRGQREPEHPEKQWRLRLRPVAPRRMQLGL